MTSAAPRWSVAAILTYTILRLTHLGLIQMSRNEDLARFVQPLVVDPQRRLVTLGGNRVRLRGRAFDLLATLAAEPGHVFSVRELMTAVWPGRFVEENNLRVQVAILRKRLGAQGILNVPGRGYALAPPAATDFAGAKQPSGGCGPSSLHAEMVVGGSDADACRDAFAVRTARRSDALQPDDFRAVYRLLGECAELWADPAAWQDHLLGRLSALIQLPVGLHAVADCLHPAEAARVHQAYERGWPDERSRATFGAGHSGSAFGVSPLDRQLRIGLVTQVNLVRSRAQLMPDRRWQADDFYQRVHRPAGMDEMLYSAVRVGRHDSFDLLAFGGNGHRPTGRDAELIGLVHRELVPMVGTRLATEGDASMHGLSGQDRRLLQLASQGLSTGEIADRLGLPAAQAKHQLALLCAHFGVNDRLGLMAYLLERSPRPLVGKEP